MMLLRTYIIVYLVFSGIGVVAVAQQDPDTIRVSGVYHKIEKFSAKRKFTNTIHGLILKPANIVSSHPKAIPGFVVPESHKRFEGKIIRQIIISTLDPFGYSVYDTTAQPRSLLEKSGNAVHVKTLHVTIRNRLLIHRYDSYDSLLVKESERLVRSESYIQDVKVTTVLTSANSDSVDVFVSVSDFWSIIADGALTGNHMNLKLADKNLAGLGHTFSYSFTQNYLAGGNAFATYYYIPNIKNTYINTRFDYSIDEIKNYTKSLNIERPFFSPVARWAGGVFLLQQKMDAWIYKNDTTGLYLESKYFIQDYWAAVAWQIFKGKSETNRTTKLILSGRIYSLSYLEKPIAQPDMLEYYTNERMLMTGLGISSRKYVKQSYIFRFGTPEDVPVGLTYGIVGGYQLKQHERWYWGLRHSWGTFYKWGYFGTLIEYGAFINASTSTEKVLTVSMNYFSNLLSIGKWKLRQFARPELTIGINRSPFDRLTINDGYGLNGFNSSELSGSRRLVVVLQTQSYAPWYWLGFRFGPYLNLAFGMLGDETSGFGRSRLYPQLGLGVLIRNDFLVFKNVQLSFAFYPSIPGKGDNILKANPFRTTDFGFPDFVIGKPVVVEFK